MVLHRARFRLETQSLINVRVIFMAFKLDRVTEEEVDEVPTAHFLRMVPVF